MASTAPGTTDEPPGSTRWCRATLALLAGLVLESGMFFLIAVVQTPGLDPPPESAALFLVPTAAGAVSYHLLRDGERAGYPAAILTALFAVAVVAVLVAGVYGPAGPRTNPVGPISYVALAVAVVATASLAWRRDTVPESPPAPRSAPE